MAGHLDDNERRSQVGRAVADAKVARLDAVIGSKLWQRIWLDKRRTTDERIGAIQDLYCSQLRERGFRYAYRIPMRDIHGKRARYTLVFATNSARWARRFALAPARRLEVAPLRVGCCVC